MSWGSGNELLHEMLSILHINLKDKISKKLFDKIIIKMVKAFEEMDCDTGDMYHDADPIIKRALDTLHPDWKSDD